MKKYFIAFFLLFLSNIPHIYSQLEPGQNLQMGVSAVNARDFEEGIRYLTDYLKTVPDDPEGRYNRAIAYYFLKDYTRALEDATVSIGQNTQFSPGFNLRGQIYTAQKNYSSAIADFNSAIIANANFGDAYMNRALVYKLQNEYPLAIADLNTALTINPTLMDAYYLRGEIHVSMGNYNDAINDLTMYANNYPDKAAVFAARGLAYFQMGKYGEAATDLEKAVSLDPGLLADYNTIINEAKSKAASK